MSGWSDEGDRRPSRHGGPAAPEAAAPGWSVRPRGMRQGSPRNLDVRDVRPPRSRGSGRPATPAAVPAGRPGQRGPGAGGGASAWSC